MALRDPSSPCLDREQFHDKWDKLFFAFSCRPYDQDVVELVMLLDTKDKVDNYDWAPIDREHNLKDELEKMIEEKVREVIFKNEINIRMKEMSSSPLKVLSTRPPTKSPPSRKPSIRIR